MNQHSDNFAARRDDTSVTDGLRCPLMSIKGAAPGPRLVVTGPETMIRNLAALLWETDGIDRIRGALVLRDDSQDPEYDFPDATLHLSGEGRKGRHGYARVMGRMTALGMIEGRGIPRRWVA